jgi:hypothetical protein
MLKIIKNRKPKFLSYDGLIASLHILTVPSKFKDKNEQGVSAENKVNGHYFYYGIPGEEFFNIDIVQENNVMMEDDSSQFSISGNIQNSLHKPKRAKKIKIDTKINNNETASRKNKNYVDEIEKLGNTGPSRLNLYCIRPLIIIIII